MGVSWDGEDGGGGGGGGCQHRTCTGDVGPGSEAITGSSGTMASPHTAHTGRRCSGSIARGDRRWAEAMGYCRMAGAARLGVRSATRGRRPPPATSGPRKVPSPWTRYRGSDREPADRKTKSFAQSWQRYALRIPVRSIVTDPVGFTAKLRQCGQSRCRVSFGDGTVSDMAIRTRI
jgi:hypothetical protein